MSTVASSSGLNAQPKFVDRCVKVVQFHTDAEGAGCGSHIVAFASCPESKINDDAQPEAQSFLREMPAFVFDFS